MWKKTSVRVHRKAKKRKRAKIEDRFVSVLYLFQITFVIKTANAKNSRTISFVYQVRMRECHLLAPALNLEMSVSVRAHAQLSNMHFSKTHLKVPNG